MTSRRLISIGCSIKQLLSYTSRQNQPSQTTEHKSSATPCFTFNTLPLGIVLSILHWHAMVPWWTNTALEQLLESGGLRGPQSSRYTHVRSRPSRERVLITEEAEKEEKREVWHTRAEMTTFPLPNHRQHDPSQERGRTCQ